MSDDVVPRTYECASASHHLEPDSTLAVKRLTDSNRRPLVSQLQ
jgi:hypothetical protein